MVYLQEYSAARQRRLTQMGTVSETRKERAERQAKAEQIVRGKQREALLDKIFDHLDDWRLSHFEFEGAVHAAVRSALCITGHTWLLSDLEADTLVQSALRRMGAKRPTWYQGQPEYVASRENCANSNCQRALSEEEIANRSRFCSDLCYQTTKMYRERVIRQHEREAYSAVWYRSWLTAQRKTAAPRECLNASCCKAYRSPYPEQKFCSYECSAIAQMNPERRRHCKRPGCGKPFVDHQSAGRSQAYCSLECRKLDWPTVEIECLQCSATFEAKATTGRASPKYCSEQCRLKFHRLAGAVKRSAKRRAAVIAFPQPLTAVVFDGWFARAA